MTNLEESFVGALYQPCNKGQLSKLLGVFPSHIVLVQNLLREHATAYDKMRP
jgi:hypothetical protein